MQPLFDACGQEVLFGQLLVAVSRGWRSVLEVRLAQLGLTDATWAPLFHLHAAQQAINLKQLAQRVGLDSSSLVRVVDLLEQRQLLQRVTDQSDRRNKLLVLTEAGNAMVGDVRNKLRTVEAQLLEGVAPEAVHSLQSGMWMLHERLQQLQQQDKAGV